MTAQRVKSFLRMTSIQYRLMLVIGLLTFGVIAIYVAASYYGMRNAALEVGSGRLNSLVDQFSTLFSQSLRTMVTATRTTGETEAVRDFFHSSGTRSRSQTIAAFEAFRPPRDSMSIVELWGANKKFLLGLTQPEPLVPTELDSEFVFASKASTFGIVGSIRSHNGSAFYPIVVAIQDGDRLLGYIVRWRRYATSVNALEQVSRLLGTQATLYMANADGSLWTDLLTAVPAHSVEILNTREMLQYSRPSGDEVLAASRPVLGTPWVIVIEFPYAAVMTGTNSFVQGVAMVGGVLLLVGFVIAWFLSRTITKPIATLTVATETFAVGDFSKPVEVARRDEIGKLAYAFNTMIERIQSSQREIEHRDVEIGKKSSELTQSEERYRQLFESNPLPMWVFDAETLAFLAVNDAAVIKYGYSRDEFLSMTIKDIRPPEELERLLDDLSQHHEGHDNAGVWKHRKKDGAVINVEITSHSVVFSGRQAKLVLANDVTERMRAEEAVAFSEERLSAIIEQSPLSIQVFAPDGTCLRANKAWEELWGSKREQLKGYNILRDPQVAARGILPYLKKAFDGELVIIPPVYYDPREMGQEGKPRWTKAVIYPVKDAAGLVREIVLSHEDVTNILKAEEALRDSEERYRIVAETASDGIITIDETSTVLFANRAISKVFGYTPDEIIGKQLTMLMPEYLRHLHKAAVERYLSTGKKHITWEGVELPGRHKNGKEIPLEVSFGEHIKDGKHTFIGIIRDISERKRAETRFRLAIDSSPNGMVIVDENGKINLFNKEAERMFGYSREEILGKGIEMLVPDRFRKHHAAFRADFTADPEARAMGSGRDLFGLRKDGTEFPLEIGLNPIEIDGKTHVLSSIVDITERKHAEERFRVAVESAPNGMVIVDENGNIVLVNSEAERLFGYPRKELLGKSIEMLVPARFRKGHVMFRSKYTTSPQTRTMGAGRDLYGLRKNGTEFPLEIGLNPIEISGKKHILGSIVDITERKRAEEALLVSEKHNESLLRFSKQASQAHSFTKVLSAALAEVKLVLGYQNVWAYLFAEDGETASLITIEGGKADSVNREFPVLQVKGDKMIEQIYEGDRPVIVEDARTDPRTNKDIVNALQNKTIINVPMMLADKKLGALGTGSFGAEGVRVPTKEQVEYFSTMGNRVSIAFNRIQLTEQRERAYTEIRKLNEDLERRVAERTALLEAANKELESFSYSVSHDLRAPLRGIEGFSRLLLEDYAATLDDEGKRFLGNIVANTSKMGQLIDDLLAFSRLSRQELRVWTVDMMNMAQSTAADVSKLEDGHSVNLALKSLPPIVCDGSMLRQVWHNLISNAYKFTRRVDNPRVEVGSYEENGERIYYVKDNGAGFDMKYYDKLFGVFQRLHRQDEFEGTGVGLGIVQRVINRHGGRVWAEAAVNQGATFYFSLPLNGH